MAIANPGLVERVRKGGPVVTRTVQSMREEERGVDFLCVLGIHFDLLGESRVGWTLRSRGAIYVPLEVTSQLPNCHSVVRHAASQRRQRHGPPLANSLTIVYHWCFR